MIVDNIVLSKKLLQSCKSGAISGCDAEAVLRLLLPVQRHQKRITFKKALGKGKKQNEMERGTWKTAGKLFGASSAKVHVAAPKRNLTNSIMHTIRA